MKYVSCFRLADIINRREARETDMDVILLFLAPVASCCSSRAWFLWVLFLHFRSRSGTDSFFCFLFPAHFNDFQLSLFQPITDRKPMAAVTFFFFFFFLTRVLASCYHGLDFRVTFRQNSFSFIHYCSCSLYHFLCLCDP